MNNLERALEMDGITLLRAIGDVPSEVCDETCPARGICKVKDRLTPTARIRCAEARAAWMLQEYVEPDSLEKVAREMCGYLTMLTREGVVPRRELVKAYATRLEKMGVQVYA